MPEMWVFQYGDIIWFEVYFGVGGFICKVESKTIKVV